MSVKAEKAVVGIAIVLVVVVVVVVVVIVVCRSVCRSVCRICWKASSNKLHDVTVDYCCVEVHIHTYYLFICTFMFLIMKLFYYWCLQLCCADDVCNRSFKSSFRNLKFHQAVSLTTVWLRISIQVLKIDMKRYRQALAVNDSLRPAGDLEACWDFLGPLL